MVLMVLSHELSPSSHPPLREYDRILGVLCFFLSLRRHFEQVKKHESLFGRKNIL